jgi:ligand-binding SRPBCC domain-containing protein
MVTGSGRLSGTRSYERSVHVDAPLPAVWKFHSKVDGLVALTPDWVGLRVEAVTGPDGEDDPEILTAGTTLELSVRPFGVGPRQSIISEITEREHGDGEAFFTDVLRDGPLPTWEHTHHLRQDDAGTLLTDRVRYRLPLRELGAVLSPFAAVGLDPLFRYRHRMTRRQLE